MWPDIRYVKKKLFYLISFPFSWHFLYFFFLYAKLLGYENMWMKRAYSVHYSYANVFFKFKLFVFILWVTIMWKTTDIYNKNLHNIMFLLQKYYDRRNINEHYEYEYNTVHYSICVLISFMSKEWYSIQGLLNFLRVLYTY